MPNLGGWELVYLGLVLLIIIAIATGLAVLTLTASIKRRARAIVQQAPTLSAEPTGLESRLAEADRLLQSGKISMAEHQAMRSRILGIS